MRHELLRRHRMPADCVFTLWLDFGAGRDRDEIDFTEFYDYPSRADKDGREYAYSVYVPARDLNRLVDALGRRCGQQPPEPDPRDTLVACFRALVDRGDLGDHLAIEGNVRALRSWLDEAGIGHREGRWAWFDSD
ncbi:hypothetical protein [Rugosimonospora africana]|uniref:Immunity protein 8 n=1 Tax=Rugosimonospora africana TaxID=556532 RepID=A0A8J3R3I1_9ACTN|nr:hypothetical protein [Rugosimonospora africana]GIH20807.1 hypothetical protein Raf01_89790 [Rugosimonospora africana]